MEQLIQNAEATTLNDILGVSDERAEEINSELTLAQKSLGSSFKERDAIMAIAGIAKTPHEAFLIAYSIGYALGKMDGQKALREGVDDLLKRFTNG